MFYICVTIDETIYVIFKVQFDFALEVWFSIFGQSSMVKKKLFVAFPWVETSTGPGGFMICVFII